MNIQTSWNHAVPSVYQQTYDLQLLTICGVSVLGRWTGELGEFYIGWAPLLGATPAQQTRHVPHVPDFDRYVRPENPRYVN